MQIAIEKYKFILDLFTNDIRLYIGYQRKVQ